MTADELRGLIRTIPDFPSSGIQFRDITPLLADGAGFAACVAWLAERVEASGATLVAGTEARGFLFGAAVACRIGCGFLPVRKGGKLPCATIGIDYALEYGSDRLEIDPTLVRAGERVAVIDDLLATGGTACAAASLLRQAGAIVDMAAFVIDLPDLGGAERLRGDGVTVHALLEYGGH